MCHELRELKFILETRLTTLAEKYLVFICMITEEIWWVFGINTFGSHFWLWDVRTNIWPKVKLPRVQTLRCSCNQQITFLGWNGKSLGQHRVRVSRWDCEWMKNYEVFCPHSHFTPAPCAQLVLKEFPDQSTNSMLRIESPVLSLLSLQNHFFRCSE